MQGKMSSACKSIESTIYSYLYLYEGPIRLRLEVLALTGESTVMTSLVTRRPNPQCRSHLENTFEILCAET